MYSRFFAYFTASQHAFMSFSDVLHSSAMIDVLIYCDTVFTASKSPGFEIVKPASITSISKMAS
jgi:hypothetical protein